MQLALSRQHLAQVPVATGHQQAPAIGPRVQPFLGLFQCLCPQWSCIDLILQDTCELSAELRQLWVPRWSHVCAELVDALQGLRIHEDQGKLNDLLRSQLHVLLASGLEVQHCKAVPWQSRFGLLRCWFRRRLWRRLLPSIALLGAPPPRLAAFSRLFLARFVRRHHGRLQCLARLHQCEAEDVPPLPLLWVVDAWVTFRKAHTPNPIVRRSLHNDSIPSLQQNCGQPSVGSELLQDDLVSRLLHVLQPHVVVKALDLTTQGFRLAGPLCFQDLVERLFVSKEGSFASHDGCLREPALEGFRESFPLGKSRKHEFIRLVEFEEVAELRKVGTFPMSVEWQHTWKHT
mmetsp:Transcript_3639/g.5211  ORF Transcript_3639/g.5211 Transcript_3639/m.5211 type:complete len:346 (+) Transcript_3639:229-1266(+)